MVKFKTTIRQVGNKENPSYAIPVSKHIIKSGKLNPDEEVEVEAKQK